MKKLILLITLFFSMLTCAQNEFITSWETTTANETITIPTDINSTYNYTVDWGDGNIEANFTGNATHTYIGSGVHTVSITGAFPRIYFNNSGDSDKLLSIEQWGTAPWESMEKAFYGCTNLVINANDNPDLSNVTSMVSMFRRCSSFNSSLNSWDVSNVTNMETLFMDASIFNQNIENWDVSSVTNMEGMFKLAENFNQNIGGWDVSNVTNMKDLFFTCKFFNQNINAWDVSNVTNMSGLFRNAIRFNQNINNWNVGNVTDMNNMFRYAVKFNQNINTWNVSNVTNMSYMFWTARDFNEDLSNWNIYKVVTISNMFKNAISFNQSIGNWDISSVVDMEDVLSGIQLSTSNYDATLIGWSTDDSGVASDGIDDIPENIYFNGGMSKYCLSISERNSLKNTYSWDIVDNGISTNNCSINGFVTTWETTTVNETITIPTDGVSSYNYTIDWGDGTIESLTNHNPTHAYNEANTYVVIITGTFPRIYFNNSGDKDKILSIDSWGNYPWLSMENAFYGCNNLNVSSLDPPNLSVATNLSNMFRNASSLNQDISAWDVSNITNMRAMFQNAVSFDQSINAWDVSNVTDMTDFLLGVQLTTSNYDAMLIAWSELSITPGVTFNSGNSEYCLGELSRNILTNSTNNWIILDNGKEASCPDFTNLVYHLNNNLENETSNTSLEGVYFISDGNPNSPSVIDTDISSATFLSTSNGSGIQLTPTEGVRFDKDISQYMSSKPSFEVDIDFIYTNDGDAGGNKPLFSIKNYSANETAIRLFCESNNDGSFDVYLLYADGMYGTQGADFSYQNKVGHFTISEEVSLKLTVDFENKTWNVLANDQYTPGVFEDDFNLEKFRTELGNYNPFLGWFTDLNVEYDPNLFSGTILVDEFSIYAPKQSSSITDLQTALQQMTSHILGGITLTQSQKNTYTADILGNYQNNYANAKLDIDNYLQAFEANFPPLFTNRNQIDIASLLNEERIAIYLQLDIFDNEFVSGNVDAMIGTAFEAAEVFPGSVNNLAPRLTNQQVTINASNIPDPGYYLNEQWLGITRPTGFYAAPGELVTVTTPISFVDSGIQIIVGAHIHDLVRKSHNINRFPRVSKRYDITSETTKIANPFGGAIYLKVPEGSNFGWNDITISGAVKSPYFRMVSGQPINVSDWQTDLANSYVKWVDVESDKMMFTIPASIVDSQDPTIIMEKWDEMWDAVSIAAGRPLTAVRSEYLLIDSRGPFDSYSSGYPTTMGDHSDLNNVSRDSWWNPLRVLDSDFTENTNKGILFHEFGHNMGIPALNNEAETIVQIIGSSMFNTALNIDIDTAISRIENETHTRDLAAMNWMISENFRNNTAMNCDPTMDSSVCHELRFQIRGGMKYIDIAMLYGWDGLGSINKIFYDYWRANGGQEKDNGFYVSNEDYIQAATEGVGDNLTSLLHFWGVIPSDMQRIDLTSNYPESKEFYDRLMYYKCIVPLTQVEFQPWYDELRATVDPVHFSRLDTVYNNYDANNIGGQIISQIDYLIDLYFNGNTTVLSPQVFLQGAALNPNYDEENLMRDDLRIDNYIPEISPFTDNLKIHNGNVFNVTGSDAIVDWIWVELRDKNDNTNILYGRSALLQRDGDIVGAGGRCGLSFNVPNDDYYVAIKHRNHLGVMSASPIALSETLTTVNFTDASNQITYGTNAQTTFNMPVGIVGMWAGNVNGDASVRYLGSSNETTSLKDIVLTEGGDNLHSFMGYSPGDVDMNGEIRYLGSGNDAIIIKDIILNHPSNQVSPSNLYSIEEQLPEN